MSKLFFLVTAIAITLCGCRENISEALPNTDSSGIYCIPTSAELQARKTSVVSDLKNQILEQKELDNGYALKFCGSDSMLDDLVNFIRTERMCCSSFNFNLNVGRDKSEIWFEIRGPEKAKEFIKYEMKL
jgi:hypothetical protein